MTTKNFTLYCILLCLLAAFVFASTKFTLPKCCRKRPCKNGKIYTCLFGAGPQKVACVRPRKNLSHIEKFWGELCPSETRLMCRMLDKDYVCGCALVRRVKKQRKRPPQYDEQQGSGASQRPE